MFNKSQSGFGEDVTNRLLVSVGVVLMLLVVSLACGQGPITGGGPDVSGSAPRLNAERPTSEQLDVSTDSPALVARLAARPDDVDALIELAALELDHVALDADTTPIDRLEKAVTLSVDPRRLENAGIYLARAGRSEAALKAFEKALETAPENTAILYRAGLIAWHSLGDQTRGERHWRRYLELAPGAPQADGVRVALERMKDA